MSIPISVFLQKILIKNKKHTGTFSLTIMRLLRMAQIVCVRQPLEGLIFDL